MIVLSAGAWRLQRSTCLLIPCQQSVDRSRSVRTPVLIGLLAAGRPASCCIEVYSRGELRGGWVLGRSSIGVKRRRRVNAVVVLGSSWQRMAR